MFAGSVKFRRPTAVPTAAAVVALAIPAAACATATGAGHPVPTVIVVRDNANGRTISVRAGVTVELILSSSYWNVTGSSASRVLRQEGATVLMPRPGTCPDIPGLGCTPERTEFTALTGGKAVISANRTSCGEALRCVGRATRFTVTVVVSS
jgi:predicted small secreted protein